LDDGGEEVKLNFLEQMLAESGYVAGVTHDALKEYLLSLDTQAMVNKIMGGVRKNELDFVPADLVSAAEEDDYPFFM
ncbi:arginine deiminase, partial [Levilactobacillus spicheri]